MAVKNNMNNNPLLLPFVCLLWCLGDFTVLFDTKWVAVINSDIWTCCSVTWSSSEAEEQVDFCFKQNLLHTMAIIILLVWLLLVKGQGGFEQGSIKSLCLKYPLFEDKPAL